MRKVFLYAVACAALSVSGFAQSAPAAASSEKLLTADEVIAKNVEAEGGMDKLKSVNTLRMSGKMTVGPGMEAPIVLVKKRPDEVRMDFTIQGMTGTQAYDGKNGWALMPFQGKKDAEPLGEDDLKEMQNEADFDGPYIDYKAKGNTVEMLGKDKVEGSDVYKLKVTRKNGDSDITYIDADSFLPIKEETKRMVRGTEREMESVLGDYKEENGIMMPHSIQQGPKGSAQKQTITIEKVEMNVPLDDSQFKQPAPAPKPAAPANPGN
jgi:outer membrane lipoprotein-sorting protein